MYQGATMKQSIFRVIEVFIRYGFMSECFQAEHFKMDVTEHSYGSVSEIVTSIINSLRLQH